jgi:Spy/CpxP family protein refolding chaperone
MHKSARLALALAFTLPSLALGEPSPYAAETGRRIKALSESDISSYLAGQGMGFARAAELNRYPGPRHVLDLAEELELTPWQITALQNFFRTMEAAAKSAGAELVAREAELDQLFATQHATSERVLALTAEIGRLHGLIRAAHLNAHVDTTSVLTPAQIARYVGLRGYDTGSGAKAHPRSSH